MFREMRRKKQELTKEECIEVLNRATSGVLAVTGDEGYPYTVPISYAYDNGKILFHSAKSGHKIDAISKDSKVSFCVIDQDQIVLEKYTSYFRSVVAFGKMRIMEDDAEKREAIEKLAIRYVPDDTQESRNRAIEMDWKPLCMLEMTIEHMTGKEAVELMKARQK